MRLLASTDIALRVLMLLSGERSGRPVSVDMLARRLGGLSRHHLHKIVQNLTAMGITRTLRGAAGGVVLAVPPAELRLGTLIRRLEEEQPSVECFRPETCTCTLVQQCRLRGMLRAAREAFYRELETNSVTDCLPPAERAESA
jgi:Rrf2 family nitric oxide-sensitive transcriptional repressor